MTDNIFKVFVGWAWDKLYNREWVLSRDLWFQEQRTSNDMLFVFSAVAYSHYMLCEAQAGDVLTGLVTLLNCSWSYAYIAQEMAARYPGALQDERYGAWFAGYVSKEYRQTNQALIDRIDALGAGIDERTTQRLCEIFKKCCLFDLRFWDMVYAMGET